MGEHLFANRCHLPGSWNFLINRGSELGSSRHSVDGNPHHGPHTTLSVSPKRCSSRPTAQCFLPMAGPRPLLPLHGPPRYLHLTWKLTQAHSRLDCKSQVRAGFSTAALPTQNAHTVKATVQQERVGGFKRTHHCVAGIATEPQNAFVTLHRNRTPRRQPPPAARPLSLPSPRHPRIDFVSLGVGPFRALHVNELTCHAAFVSGCCHSASFFQRSPTTERLSAPDAFSWPNHPRDGSVYPFVSGRTLGLPLLCGCPR